MTPFQRTSYKAQKRRLRAALIYLWESASGFDFRFADEPGLLLNIAKFVENERRGCPFYALRIGLAAGDDANALRVTGPDGARAFLRDALTAWR